MPRDWTNAQKDAIFTQDKNLLISAAAGSGKTAVLTERIIQSLLQKDNPADISRILVVTFTKVAASELRSRIFTEISNALAMRPRNRHLCEQLIRIGSAKICTIDSYYLSLVEEYTNELGLPSSFRIADFAEADILAREVMNDCIADFYETDTEEFSRLAECFTSYRTSSHLCDVLLQLYSNLQSCPDGIEFLRTCAERSKAEAEGDFFDSTYGIILKEELITAITYEKNVLSKAMEYIRERNEINHSYGVSFQHDLIFCIDMLVALAIPDYTKAQQLIQAYEPKRAKPLSGFPEFERWKKRRKNFTEHVRAMRKKNFSTSADSLSRTLKDTADMTYMLYRVMKAFDAQFAKEKEIRSICTLSDIRRYVLKLLFREDGSTTPYAKEISSRYDAIYIDEYQDVDRVQDMIFEAISNGHNRFMVGDIKQSIYQFRGADPSVFTKYRQSYPLLQTDEGQNGNDATVFMSDNFRCDSPIISFTNMIFSYLFSICGKSIGYQKQDDLSPAKIVPDRVVEEVPVEVVLTGYKILGDVETDEDEYENEYDETDSEAEMQYVVKIINDIMSFRKKANGDPFTYGDIAILYRSKSVLPNLTAALKDHNVPFSGVDETSYFENPEVLLMLCLLNAIDNPQRDIHLAGLMRSPLFCFTLDDLIAIKSKMPASYSLYDCVLEFSKKRSPAGKKAATFCRVLSAWREHSLTLTVDRLLQYLLQDDRLINCGLSSSPHILRLYEYARKFESGSFRGLYQFIEYIRKMIDEGATIESDNHEIKSDAVNLMTIHHSKGLEFPVCILCNANKKFSKEDSKESLLFDSKLGVGMKLSDGSGFARINTQIREAILTKKRIQQIEEEMRVLYVALTRARERLYITASPSTSFDSLIEAAKTRSEIPLPYTLLQCTSFLDWILTAAVGHEDSPYFKLEAVHPNDFFTLSEHPFHDYVPSVWETKDKFDFSLETAMRFKYRYASLSKIPAKIAISKLSPEVLDDVRDAALFASHSNNEIPSFFSEEESARAALARRGTLTHQFLQFCHWERTKQWGVLRELQYLIDQGFLPAEAKEDIYVSEVSDFFDSDLFTQIQNAKEIIREQRFNVLLPCSYFSEDPKLRKKFAKEKLAVQGVIDLLLIDTDGNITLVDYKTDRLSPKQLQYPELLQKVMQERHGLQLSYYALAIEEIFGRPCENLLVYATHAKTAVPITMAIESPCAN